MSIYFHAQVETPLGVGIVWGRYVTGEISVYLTHPTTGTKRVVAVKEEECHVVNPKRQ